MDKKKVVIRQKMMEKPVADKMVDRKGPDSDFYNFENNKKNELFVAGQIWAAYDHESMPRTYGVINKINYPLFRISVTWLNPVPVTPNEKKWCEAKLPVACGYFSVPKTTTVLSETKKFSHCISNFNGSKDEKIEIYPQKGDVWAVYENWRPSEWCSDPKNRKGSGFLMVEILKAYSKNADLVVGPLERVDGCISIFQRCVYRGCECSFTIPASDLCRFSHNVPAYRFTGREMNKVCYGMIELDPLVVPKDLIEYAGKPAEKASCSARPSLFLHPSVSPQVVSDHSARPSLSLHPSLSPQVISDHSARPRLSLHPCLSPQVVSDHSARPTLSPHPSLSPQVVSDHSARPSLSLHPSLSPQVVSDHSARPSLSLHPSLSPQVVSDQQTIPLKFKLSKKDFILGHIWAVYDDLNSMPRRYVRVNNFLSDDEVCVTFLELNPTSEDEIQWVEQSLPLVCGIFRAGNITFNLNLSLFSHVVTCERGLAKKITCERSMPKLFYKIFPRKGEIWVMYKNWNPKWKQSEYNQCQCQIVEILSDFSETTGITIASLVQVKDYMTFYQKQLVNGFELIRVVSRMEMLSFSHQIPSYTVSGAEIRGIPEDALHLEPDALPTNLVN